MTLPDSMDFEWPVWISSSITTVYILIHHVRGDGPAEVCGAYTSEEQVVKYCLDDSWGYYLINLDKQPMPADIIVPLLYVYPTREHKRWVYSEKGWSKVKTEGKSD